ncbi:2-oxoadipate dioxygenase/decarboxylase family protein, partial [Rhizobium phaseoli]
MPQTFVSTDRIRSLFTEAMSQMYRTEVPQYGTLIELVADVNAGCLERDPALRERLARAG